MALNRKLKSPNLADLGDASGPTLPVASFRDFVRTLRRNEFLKLKQTYRQKHFRIGKALKA
jgi:hypothetical protein